MKVLLEDRWAPITSELGFVECDARRLADWYAKWLTELPGAGPASSTRITPVDGGLEANLGALLPLTTPLRRRFLFHSTSSSWTAYFDNGARGCDAANLSLVARQLKCRGVRAVAIPDQGATSPRRGAAIWELYGPERTEFLNYVRSVSVVCESGKWRFDVAGTPQSYEDQTRYQARRVRERFDIELLARYLSALGIRAFDLTYYGRRGYLVDTFREAMSNGTGTTLAEARAALGLEPGSA